MCSNPIFLDLTFLELCLHYKTTHGYILPSTLFGGGWEGGQDTSRYTHLKSKKGYFSDESICWGDTAYEVVSH